MAILKYLITGFVVLGALAAHPENFTSITVSSSAHNAYEVRGTVDWQRRLSRQPQHHISSFVVTVWGAQWHIKLTPESWPLKGDVGEPLIAPRLVEATSDGTNVFTHGFYEFDTNDFTRGIYNPGGPRNSRTEWSDRWVGTTLHPDKLSCHREMMALWYAFASAAYLSGVTNARLVPLDSADPRLGIASRIPARFVLSQAAPHLPLEICATNSSATTTNFAAENFQTLQLTNWNGLLLPSRVKVDYYHTQLRSNFWGRTEIVVNSVTRPDHPSFGPPELAARAWVSDRTSESELFNSTTDGLGAGNPKAEGRRPKEGRNPNSE